MCFLRLIDTLFEMSDSSFFLYGNRAATNLVPRGTIPAYTFSNSSHKASNCSLTRFLMADFLVVLLSDDNSFNTLMCDLQRSLMTNR